MYKPDDEEYFKNLIVKHLKKKGFTLNMLKNIDKGSHNAIQGEKLNVLVKN